MREEKVGLETKLVLCRAQLALCSLEERIRLTAARWRGGARKRNGDTKTAGDPKTASPASREPLGRVVERTFRTPRVNVIYGSQCRKGSACLLSSRTLVVLQGESLQAAESSQRLRNRSCRTSCKRSSNEFASDIRRAAEGAGRFHGISIRPSSLNDVRLFFQATSLAYSRMR